MAVARCKRRLLWTPANHFPTKRPSGVSARRGVEPRWERREPSGLVMSYGAWTRLFGCTEACNQSNNNLQFRIGETMNFRESMKNPVHPTADPPDGQPCLGRSPTFGHSQSRKKRGSIRDVEQFRRLPEDKRACLQP